jgi:hypothetical protein
MLSGGASEPILSGVFRPLRALAALAVVAFTLTGCMKIDVAITVDGKRDVINGSFIYAVQKTLLTTNGKTLEQGFSESAADELSELPKGSRSEVYDDGKFYGRRVFFENMTFAEFNASGEGPVLTHENGRYTFTYETDATELGDFAVLPANVLDSIEYRMAVTFPGDIVERDERAVVQGRTVSWNLKVTEGHRLRVVAQEPSAFPWLLLGAVAGLFGLLVVGGLVVLAVRLHRRQTPQPVTDPTLVG